MVLETSPDSLASGTYVYSDIGFILLGLMVERLHGDSLHLLAERMLFAPLRMTDSDYRPDSMRRASTAPTEHDPWRGRMNAAQLITPVREH